MEEFIGSFDTKRGHEQVRVYVENGNGKKSISTRMFSYRKCDWRPMKNGVNIPATKVYKLTKLIDKAHDFISTNELQNT
ncbi:hypothetical protein ACFLWZ_04575 [Chloroflexota bacterium]